MVIVLRVHLTAHRLTPPVSRIGISPEFCGVVEGHGASRLPGGASPKFRPRFEGRTCASRHQRCSRILPPIALEPCTGRAAMKIKLTLESLQVQTFATSGGRARQRGTVHAHHPSGRDRSATATAPAWSPAPTRSTRPARRGPARSPTTFPAAEAESPGRWRAIEARQQRKKRLRPIGRRRFVVLAVLRRYAQPTQVSCRVQG
jgi:hypothetical protein